METLLLSGTRIRVLSPVLLCCLSVFTAPVSVKAQGPAFGNPTCSVQSVNFGMGTSWQIRGQVP